MGNMEDLVTLLFFMIESTNLASWGIFVIIGIFQGPVTLPFLKVEAQNLVSWGILTCSLTFQYFKSIISFADTL